MKTFRFTTFDFDGNEVRTYEIQAFDIKEARKYARNIIGNSRDNEERNSRITLKK